ncbi:MAG: FimV/HubP family polar landmark protein [Sulfuriferula sp.]
MSAAVWLLAQTTAAQSAGLGKLSIESALGQPLQAEIDVIATDPAELANLHARLASPEAFRNANLELNSTITHIKFVLDKTPNGGLVLKLTSDKPVNDPFIDMLVELDWGNGQMLREYTLLLDPPGMKSNSNGQNTGNLIVTPAVTGSAVAISPSVSQGQAAPTAQVRSASSETVRRAKSEMKAESASVDTVPGYKSKLQTVGPIKRGETLTAIAQQTKPDGIRLEQMLVGLYRRNEKAFDGNMNRLKTGEILSVPSSAEVAAISEKEAVREVHLQAADWHSYRQKLAGEVAGAPKTEEKPTQASGKISSAVEDKAAPAQSGRDVLKLSRGELPVNNNRSAGAKADSANAALQKQMAQDDAEAKQKALAEANERAAALEKNNKAMQKLLALKNQSLAEAQKNLAVPAPAAVPGPSEKKPVKPFIFKPVTPIYVSSNWYDAINPLYVGAGAVALLLLALLGFMNKSRSRRQGLSKFENSILTNVDHKPSTVYGAQGGASVNTNNTSFLTDFSQSGLGTLDTHEVDPIAEAEVYMAYGRDEQAEEILKEAMIKDPARQEIKLKLLEIYAARNNLPAFETISTELYSALRGEHTPVWEKAAELGRKLDPNNPLYGGQAITPAILSPDIPHSADIIAAQTVSNFETAAMTEVHTEAEPVADGLHEMSADAAMDYPLAADYPMAMDFDIEMTPVNTAAEPDVKSEETLQNAGEPHDSFFGHESVAAESASEIDMGLDFTSVADNEQGNPFIPESKHEFHSHHDSVVEAIEPAATPVADAEVPDQDDRLSFDFDLDDSNEAAQAELTSTERPVHAFESAEGPITLDFSGIDLELGSHDTDLTEAEQEVKTKFELAQVYQEMGDHENAREILQEVIKEGNPHQQASAQDLLQKLG